jgi:hypothetical protein
MMLHGLSINALGPSTAGSSKHGSGLTHYSVLGFARKSSICGSSDESSSNDPWQVTCLKCLKAGRFDIHPRDPKTGRFIKTARSGMKR